MNIDPSSILRVRDMNQVQRDILKIIFEKVKNTPNGVEWNDFNQAILYQGKRFRVEAIYRFVDFVGTRMFQFQKLDHHEEEGVIIKPKFIHHSKGEKIM